MSPFVDGFIATDVVVRFLTGDDPAKQARAKALFQAVSNGEITLQAPVTVIADAVFVLASPRLFHLPRPEIHELLRPLLALKQFAVGDKDLLLEALDIHASTNFHFGDAMIAASMERASSAVDYSYDQGFDCFAGVDRHEPCAARPGSRHYSPCISEATSPC